MSDAQAAPTEVGVPTVVAQETQIDETPGHKVFVGNLAYSTNDEGLKALFEPFQSDVLSVQVIKHGPKSAGYGFVSLSTPEAAQRAIEALHTKEVDGRPLVVEAAKAPEQKEKEKKEKRAKRRPGRRGTKAVPGEVTDAEANGEATKSDAAPGTDEAAKPKKKKKSSKRKPKRKTTEGGEAAEGAVAGGEEVAAGDAPKKRARKPRAERTPRAPGEEPAGEPSTTVVFVANLGFNIDEDELRTLFTDAGINVTSSRIARMKWGRPPKKSRGFGFVGVDSEEEQKKAIETLNGKKLGEREIVVKVAVNVPRDDEEPAETSETPAATDGVAPVVAAASA
jgi:RNA recognition motif-containing protein